MGVAGTSQSVENERMTVVDRLEPPRTVSSRTYADLFSRPEAISCDRAPAATDVSMTAEPPRSSLRRW